MRAKSMTLGEWMMLIALSVLWGGSFIFFEIGLEALPLFSIVFIRVFLAAIVLYGVLYVMGLRMPAGKTLWLSFFIMGALNNVIPFSLIVWAQIYLTGSLAAILNATVPVFAVIVAHWLTQDEKITPSKLSGVVIGFLGVIVIMGYESVGVLDDNLLAQLAVLVAALSYAFASIFGRRFKRLGVKPLITATGQLTASSVLLLPALVLIDQPWTLEMPPLRVWVALITLAVLSTALAYILFFRILSSAGATNVTLVTLLVPVSAILLGVAILNEQLELKHVLGMALIGIGLVVIDGRLFCMLKPKQATP